MKKGSGNIEAILAFVLFAGAVGFALYFLSPSRPDRLVESTTDYLFREIEQNTSVGLLKYPVAINSSLVGTENYTVAVKIEDVFVEKKVLAINLSGARLEAKREGDLFYVNSVDAWAGSRFFDLYLLEDVVESSDVDVVDEQTDYYSLGVSDSADVISENALNLLKEYYSNNYIELKKEFNIPNRVNFGFNVSFDSGGSVYTSKNIPEGIEVFSSNRAFTFLRTNYKIESGEINVKVC